VLNFLEVACEDERSGGGTRSVWGRLTFSAHMKPPHNLRLNWTACEIMHRRKEDTLNGALDALYLHG
jgi:hypothetical protein